MLSTSFNMKLQIENFYEKRILSSTKRSQTNFKFTGKIRRKQTNFSSVFGSPQETKNFESRSILRKIRSMLPASVIAPLKIILASASEHRLTLLKQIVIFDILPIILKIYIFHLLKWFKWLIYPFGMLIVQTDPWKNAESIIRPFRIRRSQFEISRWRLAIFPSKRFDYLPR